MVQLGIVLSKHHRLLSVAAMLDVFETVNKFSVQDGHEPVFEISLLEASASQPNEFSRYRVKSLDAAPQYDLLLLPAFASTDIQQAVRENHLLINWLCQQHLHGAEIASVCTGAFLLAATGLLNKKSATTHIDATEAFSNAFPSVNVQPKAIVTQDQGIYTSGGATNTFYLLLCLIENYCSRDMAIRVAKYFAIDLDRNHQTYFATFKPKETSQDELVTRLQQLIKSRYAEVSTIEDLLTDIPASRRNLARRFKHVTGTTLIDYLQKTRIEAAKKCLEQTSGGVLESMIASGYNDEKAFRLLFKKTVGMTPSAYRNKYCMRTIEVVH